MQFLRTNTAIITAVGPFLDKTDGVTPETSLTITNERITLTADTDAGSAPTIILDNVTGATSGTSNDLDYITGQDNGMMKLELAAADVNRLGRMTLTITDASNHVPVIHDYCVLPANIYDAFILGTDRMIVDVEEIGTDVITAASIAADAEVDVADAVWDALTADHDTASTFGLAVGSGTSAAAVADAVWDEARSGHTASGSFGQGTNVAASGITSTSFGAGAIAAAALAQDTGIILYSGVAQSGTSGSITLDSGASSIDDFYNHTLITTISNTGQRQSRVISDYNGTSKAATVAENWVTAPDNTTGFVIQPSGALTVTAEVDVSTTLDSTERNAIADALLNRDLSAVTVTNTRSPIQAFRFNRNKFTIDHATGALVVYKEDDTTIAWTGTISPTASIVTLDLDPT